MTATLPARDYHGLDAHRRDLATVFRRAWLCMGPAWPVREPRRYLSEVVAGVPLMVVRDGDGTLRGFANVCPHRAGPLVEAEATGSCRSMICGYHGWTFELDGSLRTARDSGLDETELTGVALPPVAVAEWRGLLFVNLADDPEPLEDWLDPQFVERVAPYPIERWQPTERVTHPIDANWKTYADNYLEGYHIPFVHPDLARAVDVSTYRVDAGNRWALHSAEPRDGSTSTGTWLWHWPNLALNLYEHGGSIERWWPTGPSSCALRLDFCFADTDAEAMDRNRADVESSTAICLEDKEICEVVQRGLESGAYDRGVLSPRHEEGLAAFQALVRASHDAPEDRP